jgi:hypothetical protein
MVEHGQESVTSIVYSDLGDRAMPKERAELFAGGRCAVINDFSELELYIGGRRRRSRHKQDKGHRAQMSALADAIVKGEPAPVSLDETIAVMRATLLAAEAQKAAATLRVADGGTLNPGLPDPLELRAE